MKTGGGFQKVFDIMHKLSAASIHHDIASYRDGYIAVQAVVPGQRWEIEIAEDGEIVTEVFKSDGKILDENELEIIIDEFSG